MENLLLINEREFNSQQVVGHLASGCKQGITSLETPAGGVELQMMLMGENADVEITVWCGIRARQQALLNKSKA